MEDEWLIVHILRQLTLSHPTLWVRVFDSDGEFLLVEAAKVIPKWLSPEIDHNRVWIHASKLFVIPYKEDSALISRNISLPEAVAFLKTNQKALVHSDLIEAEAFYRLEKYPGQIADSIHHSIVTIPRKLSYIVHSLPKSVGPAVEAFYLRDALTLEPILSSSSSLILPPKDLVTVSVRFSKVLFAQLRSQRFETPPRWQSAFKKPRSDGYESTHSLDNGMKLTCGFEMLAAKAAKSKSKTARELAIVIEDLQEDGDEVLPTDEDMKSWPNADRNDSEAWLDINFEDFERELDGKEADVSEAGKEGFGDAKAQENLRKIVSRFEAFLNDDTAGLDGVEMDEMDQDDDSDDDLDSEEHSDAEDKEVSFDEEQFSRMMREMMGLPSPAPGTKASSDPKGKGQAESRTSTPSVQDDEDEEIRKFTSQVEAELNEHGALKAKGKERQAKLKDEAGSSKDEENDEDVEEDSEGEVDIDYNMAKNILESFKSQGGMPGPTGNLLGLMGLQLPRDEEDGDRDVGQKGASS